ncbi:MAG TPA: ankyrin repeat domain-containing protein [Pyrinomonadaceae bacterium]|nr:ankyrin repeat domain-containing protein [Pyrinomonadaceae bacterium]
MPKRIDVLDRIHVAAPCRADWDKMAGNEQVRFCLHCSKHVHDLSKITRNDARKLVAASGGSLCVRYQKRPDGTLKTAEHAPQPLTQIKRRLSRIAAGAFTASLSLAQSVTAQTTARPAAGNETQVTHQQTLLGRILVKPVAGELKASLVGNVYDPQQAAVPGATVVLINQATGQEQTVTTGDDGAYQFSELEPGTYTLRVGAENFITFEQAEIVFVPGSQKRIDASLDVGGVTMGVVTIVAPTTPLVHAVWEEDMTMLQTLLSSGADVNVVDEGVERTALAEAASKGKLEFVQALIQAGADPNIRGSEGRTALLSVDEDATPEIVNALVAAGAKVNLRDEEGNSALHAVAGLEKSDVVRALLNAGGRVNGRNKEGRTPLMVAAAAGHLENVKELLRAGADTSRKDDDGKTALMYAEANGHREVVAQLKAYGAQE